MKIPMIIAADTHVHLYPYYDLVQAFKSGFNHLNSLMKNPSAVGPFTKLLFLTEGQPYHFFHQFKEGVLRIEGDEFTIQSVEERILEVTDSVKDKLYLIAGRQIVSKDRIEILGLMQDEDIQNGLASEEIIEQILSSEGIPVLSWAPGKWFFKRGKIIQSLLKRYSNQQILIGDTTLRPDIFKIPSVMLSAQEKGYQVLAGTDPLPFQGEEQYIGSYGIISKDVEEEKDLFSTIRSILLSGAFSIAGKRGNLPSVVRRLGHHFFCRCL
ncbi:MAG: hypothetical protein JW774_11440 [Candidatus Aureabacteria bacterium]|nr:hypothetical protein [Candidatus Auribacterota bacterium]